MSEPPRYFYFARWRYTTNGYGIQVVGKKTEVTDSVQPIIGRHTNGLKASISIALERLQEGKADEATEQLKYALSSKGEA